MRYTGWFLSVSLLVGASASQVGGTNVQDLPARSDFVAASSSKSLTLRPDGSAPPIVIDQFRHLTKSKRGAVIRATEISQDPRQDAEPRPSHETSLSNLKKVRQARLVLSDDYATHIPPCGTYSAENATWNVGNLVNGKDFTESVILDDPNSPNINTTISWNFPNTPATGNVYSFPAVHYGDFVYGPTNNVVTEQQINKIKTLTLTQNVSLSGETDQYGVIYDGFLSSAPGFGDSSTLLHEIEVYVHTPSYTRGWIESQPQHSFTDSQGMQWIIATGGPGGSGHIQIVFAPANFQDLTNHTIDLKALLQAAVANGVISGDEYFNGIAFGVEPRAGRGSMTINSFSVDYDGDPNHSANGVTPAAARCRRS